MADRSITLQRAGTDDIPYIETLLETNDLPATDVRSKPASFYIASDGTEPVGIGGIERFDAVGLLRSVVVETPIRGTGVGTALCRRLEEAARVEGIATLYLLTTTATGFFANQGYSEIDRSDAPSPIRQTTQFADLCPTTATCMKKSL